MGGCTAPRARAPQKYSRCTAVVVESWGKGLGLARAARDVFFDPHKRDRCPSGAFAELPTWHGHRGGPMPGEEPGHRVLCDPPHRPAPKGRAPCGADVRVAQGGREARQAFMVLGWLHRSSCQGAAKVFTLHRRCGGVVGKGLGLARAARDVFSEPLQLARRPSGGRSAPPTWPGHRGGPRHDVGPAHRLLLSLIHN